MNSMVRRKFKVDCMDLEAKDIKVLEQWLVWLREEVDSGGSGVCVPIKAEIVVDEDLGECFSEWVPALDWDSRVDEGG